MVGPTRREKQRRRTSKHARKKKQFLVMAKVPELKEKGASVSRAIRQLQSEPKVHLQRMDDSMMYSQQQQQQHRNYHSCYPQRGWTNYDRRRSELDDVWRPNYDDDDDHDEPNNRWSVFAKNRKEDLQYQYEDYARSNYYNRRNNMPNYITFQRQYRWTPENRNGDRSRPYSYQQRSRIPSTTSTVPLDNRLPFKIPSFASTNTSSDVCTTTSSCQDELNIEKLQSSTDKTVQRRLSCTKEQVVSERSAPDILGVVKSTLINDLTVSEKTLGNIEEPSILPNSNDAGDCAAEGNKNTSLNNSTSSLDPLKNPEFHSINLENCVASPKDPRTKKNQAIKEAKTCIPGVVEIEVEIAPYPEEAISSIPEKNCDNSEVSADVDRATEPIVYAGNSVVYDNEVTVENIITTSSYLDFEKKNQTLNQSVKRKNEDSTGGKVKKPKTCDYQKTESIKYDGSSNKSNYVKDNLNAHVATELHKSNQDGQSKVVANISNHEGKVAKYPKIQHKQRETSKANNNKLTTNVHETNRAIVHNNAKIAKRRKTIHTTSPKRERSKSQHKDGAGALSDIKNNRKERSKSLEPDIHKRQRRITRSMSQELGLLCEPLSVRSRRNSLNGLSKSSVRISNPPGGKSLKENPKPARRRRSRVIRDSSTDGESDVSSVSYKSSSSEKKLKRTSKHSRQVSKPKIIPTSPVNTKVSDPRLHKSQITSTPPHTNSFDQKLLQKRKDLISPNKTRNLVSLQKFLNEYERATPAERPIVRSPISQIDFLFGPHSDNEDSPTSWCPKQERTWSPQFDDNPLQWSPDLSIPSTSDKSANVECNTTMSKSKKEKKAPWDHSLRCATENLESKAESKKVHRRLSMVNGEADSRQSSLVHNTIGKHENVKINGERRSSVGHTKKSSVVERRTSLTPITNTFVANDTKESVKKVDDRRSSSCNVSSDNAANMKKIESRRSSELKKPLNGHTSITSNKKQTAKKIEERRSSDVKKDKKSSSVHVSNSKDERKGSGGSIEKRKPSIEQRRLSIELKHATVNQLLEVTFGSIIYLESIVPESKTALLCKHWQKVKPREVTVMPLIKAHEGYLKIKQPTKAIQTKTETSSSGNSSGQDRNIVAEVIDLCNDDDNDSGPNRVRDINSINSLMREVFETKPPVESPSDCITSAGTASSTNNIQDSGTSATLVEMPVVRTVGQPCDPTVAPVTEIHSSRSTVVEQIQKNCSSKSQSAVPNLTCDMPELTITLIDIDQNKHLLDSGASSSSSANTAIIAPVASTTNRSMGLAVAPIDSSTLPVANTLPNVTISPNIIPFSNMRQQPPQQCRPMIEHVTAEHHHSGNGNNIVVTHTTTTAIINATNNQQFLRQPTVVSHEDFVNAFGTPLLIYIDIVRVVEQFSAYYLQNCRISKEAIANELQYFTATVPASLNHLAKRLLDYLQIHEIANFNLKTLLHYFNNFFRRACSFLSIGTLQVLGTFVQIFNVWNVTHYTGFLRRFMLNVLINWKQCQQRYEQLAQNVARTRGVARTQGNVASGVPQHSSVNQNSPQPVQEVPVLHRANATVETAVNPPTRNFMTDAQRVQFFSQCETYRQINNYLRHQLHRAQVLPNPQTQPVQQQRQRRGSAELRLQRRQSADASNSSAEEPRRRALDRITASGIYPQINRNAAQPSVPPSRFLVPQQLQQQEQSLNNNLPVVPDVTPRVNLSWPAHQNTNIGRDANVPQQIKTVGTFVPLSSPLPQTSPQPSQLHSLLRQQTEVPISPTQSPRVFNPFPNDEFRIRLPLSQPFQPTTTSASFTAAVSTSTATQASASTPTQVPCATLGDCVNATIVSALATNVSATNPADNEQILKQEDEDVIDVDQWYEKRMNDEVVCLNPEYFIDIHIKPDIDQIIKTEENLESGSTAATEYIEADQSSVQQQITDPTPPRIASVDSGFSSPRQIEHPEILSGERMCICSKKAELVCGCRLAIYCSRECQVVDWPNHGQHCQRAMNILQDNSGQH